MAQQALSAGTTRKRALFGLLDADGWGWASIKAAFWFVMIIMLLGYLPDRAYYFTVFSTIDIGLNPQTPPASYVTPINLCPAENGGMPCPVPGGAVLPWEPSPERISLPAGRTDGSAIQLGTKLLYIGGSDGQKAVSDVFVAEIVDGSTFDTWQPGPALPEGRSNAAAIFSGGSIYLIGGLGPDGKPQTTVWSLTPDSTTGAFTEWKTVDKVALEEGRAGAAVVAAPDGLLLVGGANADGPTTTVWKSSFDTSGALTAWKANQELLQPRTDASASLIGDYLWVYGGSDASGPTATVQRGTLETPTAPAGSPPGTAADPSFISSWAVAEGETNLPVARTDAAGFTANGSLYLVGGSDGSAPKGEVYWAIPTAQGVIPRWEHLSQMDLPAQGLTGGAAVVSGATAFVIAGQTDSGLLGSAVRSNLAPAKPFFQLGPLGATIPALQIEGEIGQQLGYLNAAGVGTVDFILLLLVGWAFAHKARARAIIGRFRRHPR
jgi:hypothetical protein